jgi:hypothetical protein
MVCEREVLRYLVGSAEVSVVGGKENVGRCDTLTSCEKHDTLIESVIFQKVNTDRIH